jgi:hypothetical protein
MSKNFNSILADATKELAELDVKLKAPTKGGKKYTMVADRVRIFRKHFGIDARIDTEQVHDGDFVRSETTIWVNGEMVANGIAEENRNFGMINKTSAAEVSETSSIGRALANLGLQGGEYPSGDEILIAIKQQGQQPKAVTKKTGQTSSGNKANGSGSQPGQSLPPGWDKLKKADQVQFFAECLNKATHPGNLREIVTKFKSWKESLTESDQQELGAMFSARNKELKGE